MRKAARISKDGDVNMEDAGSPAKPPAKPHLAGNEEAGKQPAAKTPKIKAEPTTSTATAKVEPVKAAEPSTSSTTSKAAAEKVEAAAPTEVKSTEDDKSKGSGIVVVATIVDPPVSIALKESTILLTSTAAVNRRVSKNLVFKVFKAGLTVQAF